MPRYGVAFSQQGIALDRAADYQKVLDSDWPLLTFSFIGTVRLKVNVELGAPWRIHTLHTHNLGFLPAYFLKIKTLSPSPANSSYIFGDEESISVMSFPGFFAYTLEVEAFLMVVDRNLSTAYTAENKQIHPGPAVGAQKYGVKIIKRGGSINRKPKTNFSLHTNAKSLGIHKAGTASTRLFGSSYRLVIDHNVGYPPTYLISQLDPNGDLGNPNHPLNNKIISRPLNAIGGATTSTAATLTIERGAIGFVENYMYAILKDPADNAR